ncbi:Nramp family divalent metal transporter [Aquabacter spiritensis]|uniref:Manganese transport protein n=1 Tax=Aquabacter spiritensis TaxID=933073 RepID=A0A4V2UYA6_9HYPH|nr:Nramp family divalent metal transporter [Aquabacter spiritensis]TCT06638.1 manganese transport protein [Aquabacter spiritensis]
MGKTTETRPQAPEIPLPRGEAYALPGAAPVHRPAWWKFFGPAFIISIGYFDPGNWATDLQAGSQFGYTLLWVLSLSCLIGALVQNLCAKLGIASGKDLAQHCAERYPPWMAKIFFVSAVISMMATDLAEIIGVAVALHLLFGIPLWQGAIITIIDVFLILLLNRWGFRAVEMVFLTFLTSVSVMYVAEMFMSRPDYMAVALDSVIPSADILAADALFVAVGIIGATIMPHNLYLHSHLALSRLREKLAAPETLYRWSLWDTNISLFVAWFINAAILVVAAAVFHPIFLKDGTVIQSFNDAYKTLVPILSQSAGLIFALALLVSGVASSTSATLAGQVVFEGFLKMEHVNPFLIRLVTRLVTMAPALIAILMHAHPVDILMWSQVILSIQLPFAMLPLVMLTDDRAVMGAMVNRGWVRLVMWPATAILLVLNIVVLGQTIGWIPGG